LSAALSTYHEKSSTPLMVPSEIRDFERKILEVSQSLIL
jgi:hypothetical protein